MKEDNSKSLKRFEKIYTDPKFKPIPKLVQKVELKDNRFEAMFTNKDFISSTGIDEYGRKIDSKRGNIKMEDYYIQKDSNKKKKKEKLNNEVIKTDKIKLNNINEENISEEESDTSEEFQEFLLEMQKANTEELNDEIEEQENIPTGEATNRFAVQNLDWDNIHALDLFILFNSFCKGNQKVLKVEIYPSEYGIKEREKENRNGPDRKIFIKDESKNDVKNKKNENEENEENSNSENEEFDPVELRKYELKKLKYYYAVVYCDSIETADYLYKECNDQEIERTQCFMDIRFIPDDLKEFPYPPKEICDHIPINKEYIPNFKPNAALQDTKVKFTWDQNDPKRNDLIERAFHKEGFKEDDINELLVSSDSDDSLIEDFNNEDNDDNDNNEFNLLKKKKKGPKFKDGETIEIKFNDGFEGINTNVKNEGNEKKNKSKWEKYKDNKKNIRREKKKEERKRREEINKKRNGIKEKSSKEELKLLVDKSINNKGEFKFNPNDERFNTKNNFAFAVDPTNKNYKKTKRREIE